MNKHRVFRVGLRAAAFLACAFLLFGSRISAQQVTGRILGTCLPTKSATPASGPLWLHEIKHDGFRVIACKDRAQVRLYSRPGNDLTKRFPLIVETLAQLRCRSCVIDGEAVACGADGRSNFDFSRYRHHDDRS